MMVDIVTALVHAALVAATADSRAPSPGAGSLATGPRDVILRLARSDNGLTFTDLGTVFAVGAAAPDLTVLPNGDLLALFDYWVERKDSGQTVMAVSRSKDNGKNWSPMRLARLHRPGGQPVPGQHGDLVEVAAGRYRLFFALPERRQPTEREGQRAAAVAIRSAVTPDGLDYVVDADAQINLTDRADLHPLAVRVGDEVVLYAAAIEPPNKSTSRESQRLVLRLVSGDGRHFREGSPARAPAGPFVGSLIPIEDGIRAYVTAEEGVGSLVSRDGRVWRPEPGLRLAGGWDPAVAQLDDGSYLMIYCAKRSREATGSSARGDSSGDVAGDASAPPDGGQVGDQASGQVAPLVTPPSERELARFDEEIAGYGQDGADREVAVDSDISAGADTDQFADAEQTADAEQIADTAQVAGTGQIDDFAGEWPDDSLADPWTGNDWPPEDDLGLAPKPDLEHRVDYVEWFEQNALGQVEDNAFDSYADFMPDSLSPAEGKPEWPDLVNMFNDESYTGPPGPWDPEQHPEWEASSQAAQEVLDLYRQAGLKEGYAYRPQFSEQFDFETADGRPLLVELMLPSLRPHRDLAKATLADAWRLEEGRVPPERMLDAFETTLRNANHLTSGPTLIEGLVATAERALVEKNARWALAHGVFDEAGLEQALDVLQCYDRDETDPAKWTRGEHAMCMQTIQHVFDGSNPDGPNLDAAEKMAALMGDQEASGQVLDDLAEMDRDDAHEAVDALDNYYRELTAQWRIGYPEVRAADLQATTERYRDTNGLTRMLLPSLSRVHVIRTRSEASRRATQLAYATHLFRARQGRWPASLDELPDDFGEGMRTDPFTGSYFGYRLTEDGPMIYSAAENGVDDGGIHSPRWDDEITNDAGSDDYVFWPPQDQPS